MLGRENAKGEIPGIGELEHLLYVQDEMVEPALAHEAGGEQKLAAGAPEIGYCKTGDPLAEAELKRGTRRTFIVIERLAELRRRRCEARFDAGDLVRTEISGQAAFVSESAKIALNTDLIEQHPPDQSRSSSKTAEPAGTTGFPLGLSAKPGR